jgi:hypothetical protein
MTIHMQRIPKLVKAAYRTELQDRELQKLFSQKIAKARIDIEEPDHIARVDVAHRSGRGHRGGNFGSK